MKRIGRFLIILLCLALISSCFISLVACVETPNPTPDDTSKPNPDDTPSPSQPKTYTVTVANYSKTRGSVTLTPPASGDKYAEKESVTVTVTPKLGNTVASFAVSGYPDAALTDGRYTFQVTADATVTVKFAEITDPDSVAEQLLSLLSGSALFEATMVEKNLQTQETVASTYIATFDEASQASVFQNIYLGETVSYLLLTNADGKAAIVSHDEFGKVQTTLSEDGFEDFDNPFKDVRLSDLTYSDNLTWVIEDSELGGNIIATISTWVENVTRFELSVIDGEPSLYVECYELIEDGDGNQTEIERYYNIGVTQLADGALADKISDYEETSAHETLRQALQRAADATSYTVHYHSEEEGYDDVDGNVYFTPDGLYEDTVGWENGYVVRPDGNVWAFYKNDDGEFYFLDDFYKNISISDLGAKFVIQGASLSMLEYLGDGVFAMRFEDTVLDGYYTLFPGYFAQYFATGLDEPRYFSTAITFELELRDDALYRVRFVYDYYGYIREEVTLTFDNWNGTELPINLSDDFVNGTIAGDYCGSWADDGFAYTLTVTPDSIRINGDPAENIQRTAEGYSFVAGDNSYRLKLDGDTLVLQSGSSTTYLHKTQTPWLDFLGIYSGVDGNDVPYSVVIGEMSLTLFVGGNVTTIDEFEYGYEFSQQYETYIYTFDFTYNGAHAFLYLNANQTNQFVYGEDHEDDASDKTVVLTVADCRWEKYLGAFEGSKNGVTYRAVVAPYGIYLYEGDAAYVAQNIEYDSYSGFTFDIEGAEDSVCLSQNGYKQEVNSVGLYFEHSIRKNVELDRVTAGGAVHPTDELFKPDFWGTWISEDGSVTIVITANSLTINGEEIDATYDNYGGYQIEWGIYVAMELAIWKGDGWLVISNADLTEEIYFYKAN